MRRAPIIMAVTLPFDSGIGILPAPLVMEYGDRMRAFAAMREQLIEREFLADPQKWVDWAQRNHNGTFDPDLYPGCFPAADLPEAERLAQVLADNTPRKFLVDAEEFRSEMREKFSFKTEPLPVPDARKNRLKRASRAKKPGGAPFRAPSMINPVSLGFPRRRTNSPGEESMTWQPKKPCRARGISTSRRSSPPNAPIKHWRQ